ncbi:3'-5' exonuclease [Alicyclobacillus contaminans]|uniref:3'-5' exonuclease n=1 Tax=Alicyclobacillus contaminans TaxID=392016 RepID=UPI0003F7E369|nr:3'-5' exonuclease [Alicyclobacillus contaminans]
MQLIVHDVEAIVQKGLMFQSEIIEIAAIRVRLESGQLKPEDTFHTYVEPQSVTSIPVTTTKLTGITQAQVERAGQFPEVMERFLAWLGSDEYFLCSWSLSDRDYFIADCKRHNLSLDWIRNYNDIQRWFGQVQRLEKRTSLKRAMEMLQIAPEGQEHSALVDAQHTLQVLLRIFNPDSPVFTLERNDCSGVYQTEVVYEEEFHNNPFAALKDVLGQSE